MSRTLGWSNKELESTKALLESSNILIVKLNETILALEGDKRTHGQQAAIMKEDMNNLTEELNTRKSIDGESIKALQIKVAELTGKLSVKPRPVPAQIVQPLKIPDFNINSVVRGTDGKISGATITPVGLN